VVDWIRHYANITDIPLFQMVHWVGVGQDSKDITVLPQSNGKIERFHGSLKRECIRPKTPLSLQDARQNVARYINDYNAEQLHSAIGYIEPIDKLEGRHEQIKAQRKQKLSNALEQRKIKHKVIQLQRKINLDENKDLAHNLSVE